MTKKTTVVAVITLALIVAAPAMAYREMRMGFGRGPGNVEDIAEERDLDLTAEQKEKIIALREAHLKDIKPFQDQLYVKGRELRGLWLAKTPDRESILALQKEVQNLRNQLMDKLTNYRLEVRQILTPEQQAKILPYGPEHRPRRMGGPGMRGDDEHGRGMRKYIPSPAGVAP